MASNWRYVIEDDMYEYVGHLPPHTFISLWRGGTTPAGHPAYRVRIEQYGTSFWLETTSPTNRSTPRSCWRSLAAKENAERWINDHTRNLP